MAKRSSSGSLATVLKVLSPSYYLRKAHRLAFLCLFFVILLFIGIDRQNSYREREIMANKLQELEVEREKLESELTKVQQVSGEVDGTLGMNGANGAKADSKLLRGGTKQQPLILGVTQRGGVTTGKNRKVGVDSGSHDEGGGLRGPRKLLPDEKVKPLVIDNDKGKKSFSKEDSSAKRGSQAKEGKAVPKDPEEQKNDKRREAIRWGMIHSWGAYEQYAWGYDELQPQSKRGVNHFGGLGATIVDSLDTLYIMGLKDQFEKAKKWTLEHMDFDIDYDASVFETTIRVLGGLLSAYDLSGEEGFLKKAKELGDRLLPAWDTQLGLPWTYLNLRSGKGYNPSWTGGSCILADSGTTTVEMIGLSQRTGDPKYAEKAERVIKQIETIFPEDGLVPLYISASGQATTSKISMGAMGDSYYEYLLKVWVQGGKTKPVQHYRDLWDQSMKGMKTLVQKTTPSGFTYVAERVNDQLIHKMDHLACFLPGMLVLGAEGPHADEYLQLAKELARTCYEFYNKMPSKLSGEHYLFPAGADIAVGHAYNIGRPETVESLMYLWRKTHDPIYREWGWNIWQAFEKQCRLPSGYTGLQDVSQDPPVKDDMMQSFFLAETLKYLYLLFSPDDVMPLDEWVFNTEAHAVKIISRAGEGATVGKNGSSTGASGQGKEEPKEVFSDR